MVGSGNEICLKNLNAEEKIQSDASDEAEWRAIFATAVKNLSGRLCRRELSPAEL